jgi:adenylate cyclase
VDDDPMVSRALQMQLQRLNYRVCTADSGEAALAMMRAQAFDTVLLDVMMPGMSGFDVLETMRASRDLRMLPVLMVTGQHDTTSALRGIELGADDYLAKPPSITLLHARVKACVARKRMLDLEQAYTKQLEIERKQLEAERARVDALLANIFPKAVIHELTTTMTVRPRKHEDVAVLFCDVVGFTAFCDQHPPEYAVELLQRMVWHFEDIARSHNLEKIKTVGDAFMATAGLLEPCDNPVLSCARAGMAMQQAVRSLPVDWQVRVGIHVGPVVAGVIGHSKYMYDVWGDTVNTASRVESHAQPGTVALSHRAWSAVKQHVQAESRGFVPMKGKGTVEIFEVVAVEPTAS